NSIRLADGAEVQIIWQPGKRKSISISMPNSEQLLVKYPTSSSREKVMGWVLSQQAWIQKKRQKSLGKEDTNRAFFEKLFSEHEIVLLDVKRKVRVSSVRKESGVFDDEVVLWIKDANISREQFLEVLVKTIKKWALKALQEEFELKLAQMGPFRYPYRKFFLTSAKTRWGSCSSRGHVRIHWNTVFVTKSERDYLYTHEAAHLTEMNHSPRFWQLVEVHCPGYKRARTILHSRTLGFL
ncbi:M48 family metallopeptidase, partial [Parasutterella sp.]